MNLRISGWVQPNCCLSLSVWWFVYCHHLYSLFTLLCFHFLLIKSRPRACVMINSNKWRKLTLSPSLLLVAPDLLQLPPYFSLMKRCLQKIPAYYVLRLRDRKIESHKWCIYLQSRFMMSHTKSTLPPSLSMTENEKLSNLFSFVLNTLDFAKQTFLAGT